MEPYPAIEPYETRRVDVGDGHVVEASLAGAAGGRPVCVLHGGPGSGRNPLLRRLFDPTRWLIVEHDQRGCGASAPLGRLEANTTAHLISDIERIREAFGVDRWAVVGGSWGSTLALSYAAAHRDRVTAMALYGVFLGRRRELDALYGPDGAAARLLPEAYAAFQAPLAPEDRAEPLDGYGRLFASGDETVRRRALRAWTRLEKEASQIVPDRAAIDAELSDAAYVEAHSSIELHYFRHNCFIDGDALLDGAARWFDGLPIELVNGRYDLVTPIETAVALAEASPSMRLTAVPAAGHSLKEPALRVALQAAIDRLP